MCSASDGKSEYFSLASLGVRYERSKILSIIRLSEEKPVIFVNLIKKRRDLVARDDKIPLACGHELPESTLSEA